MSENQPMTIAPPEREPTALEMYVTSVINPLMTEPYTVIESKDEKGGLITIYPSAADMGRVVGKKGKTAYSLRHLVNQYVGMRGTTHVSVKISDENTGNTNQ